jgi:YidC/Oxa1 family membrane protein insertase
VLDTGRSKFGGAVATGGPRNGRQGSRLSAVVSQPMLGGVFGHSVYVGPQEYRRLAALGHDLNDINPYGWILRPVIQPFSVMIVHILLWMHENLSLAYGWVLVVFGVLVRVVLWPLNQKAMKSSLAMQALQPEMKALQDRHRNDPQKLQQEMLKLYRTHGVSPLGGCLPMLIPMPVLFALFFVFANTIEFRGVPFLWLPDLSRADPLYIIPILMGLSMYALTKIGQVGMPPNPQSFMFLYVMPVMFTVLFLQFSSGLNLYYAVSNIASLPQQWLISRERLRRLGKTAT